MSAILRGSRPGWPRRGRREDRRFTGSRRCVSTATGEAAAALFSGYNIVICWTPLPRRFWINVDSRYLDTRRMPLLLSFWSACMPGEAHRIFFSLSFTSRAHAADFASSIQSLQVGTFPRDKPLCPVRTGQVWSRPENHRTDVVSVYIWKKKKTLTIFQTDLLLILTGLTVLIEMLF